MDLLGRMHECLPCLEGLSRLAVGFQGQLPLQDTGRLWARMIALAYHGPKRQLGRVRDPSLAFRV
jgi:hypothetical protein